MVARLEAIVTGTGVVPVYGRSLFDENGLRSLGEQLTGRKIPMLLEHELDEPIEVEVVSTDVRQGADGEWLLHAVYDIRDEELAKFEGRMGMSIGFMGPPILPPEGTQPDSRLGVDPTHFTRAEVVLATERLATAGFSPAVSAYIQLAELPPPTVIFELLGYLPKDLGWAVIAAAMFEGLKIFLHRGKPTKFRIIRHVTEKETSVTAEIETSSDRALHRGLRALKELDTFSDGTFVREIGRQAWRPAGNGRKRRKPKRRR